MRKYLVLLTLFTAAAMGQATRPQSCVLVNAQSCNMGNANGAYGASFEEIPAGGPATVSVTIAGCMQGNTCDTAADTNTATTATVRGVTFSKVYDYFKITATLTGGTSPTVTVNSVVTTANSHTIPPGGAVTSFNTRTGAVTPASADYTCAQVTNCPALSGTGLVRNTGTATELSGDATTSGTNVVNVAKINGTALSGLATGLLKNTTTTGVPSIAAAGTDYVAPGGALGTPSSGVGTNITGLPISTGVSGLGTGVATFLATPSSANLITAVTDETGTGALVFGTAPTITLANGTGLPISTGVSGLGTGVGTFLATPSSANLASALTDEVGAGSAMFGAANSLIYYGVDSGAANAYVVTTTPALAAYTTGVIVCFVPTNAPTGASTVNVSGLGTKNWMKSTTTAVAALAASGDMITATSFCGQYDGTQFVLLNPSSTIKTAGALTTNGILRGNSANQATGSGGILSTGGTVFTTYNSVATAGVGMTSVQASPSVVTLGSGTSIGNTSLCSTTLCPAGTYRVNIYIDVTTACSTTGTYVVNLLYTDDQGAKSVVSNINGTGATPATGVLTLASTANFGEDSQIIRTTGAANNALGSINYSTTAGACGTGGPAVGNIYLSVERIM